MLFNFNSHIFEKEKVSYAGAEEFVVRGGRHLFEKLPRALEGIQKIAVIGWGSQGPAQAMNLRDSLAGSAIKVTVGLRKESPSWQKAKQEGFSEADGTLQEMMAAIREADMVLLLIADSAQAKLYQDVFKAIRPGATLGLSHGFLVGYLKSIGVQFPDNINIIGVCPKGMGPSVRRLYVQGKELNGAGINTSFAIEQDIDGKATDYALAWSIGLGAPFTFMTSLEMEYCSDIFGERGILLGAVHGIVECLYRRFVSHGDTKHNAFLRSTEQITGIISRMISHEGILPLYNSLSSDSRRIFERVYSVAYRPLYALMSEIYDEVASQNEIRSVIMAGERLREFPMPLIDGTEMWNIGTEVREARAKKTENLPLDPETTAIYLATLMAQVDLLAHHKHAYSEIVNESIIEAVDSLNPYMHHRGVGFMIDNCSTTARLGARKWAARFDYILNQSVFAVLDGGQQDVYKSDDTPMKEFHSHSVHEVLATLLQYRPSVDISFS